MFLTFLIIVNQAFAACSGSSPTRTAASASQTEVEACITAASAGDTINVPAGSATWTGMSVNKAVKLAGAGVGQTNITLGTGNTFTKQTTGAIRVTGFSFSKTSGGNESKGISIEGPWQGRDVVIFTGNAFTISDSGLFLLLTCGGAIIANNTFTGDWDDSFIQPKNASDTTSWVSASTMGADDATGKLNHYIENNTFDGGTNQGIDADDCTRVVYRYNTLTYSTFNSHGFASSVQGVRHWEVYNNAFRHLHGTTQLANQNWSIWIRGGTGVIFNNDFDDIAGSFWGAKREIKFSIRGAEDIRPQGACGSVSYPVPHQLGQSHNGTTSTTDPIYWWGNTGDAPAPEIAADWNWGNPCGFTWTDFFSAGRDYVADTTKPGYTAYTYPHPLLSEGGGSSHSRTRNGKAVSTGKKAGQ